MIGKIFNWLGGGFFRTIGRFIAFIVLGAVISILLSKFNIKIGSLFGLEYVKADSYYQKWDQVWYDDANLTQMLTPGTTFMYKTFTTTVNSNSNLSIYEIYGSNKINIEAIKGGHITIPFVLDIPSSTYSTYNNFTINDAVCKSFSPYTNGGYYCSDWDDSYTSGYTEILQYETKIQLNVMVRYTSGYNDVCEIDFNTNYISCPIANANILDFDGLIIAIKGFNQASNVSYRLGIGDKINGWSVDGKNVQDSIDNQTQQQQQQHNETMSYFSDTNMTETNSTATSFFDNFTDTDHGGLSSIITAPLTVINGMLSNTCVSPSATWQGATITLPCGDMFWNRQGADQLRNLLNVFYGGFVCYYAIRRLFLLIERMKDPTSDNIEVAEL